MARPCFPFPPANCSPAELWDGTTLYNGYASSSSSSYVPVCGTGTLYPIGLTLEELAWLFCRVRIFNIEFSVEYTDDTGEVPLNYESYSTDLRVPFGANLNAYGGIDGYSIEDTEMEDKWGALKEAGAALVAAPFVGDYFGCTANIISGDTGFVINPATTNFAEGEVIGSTAKITSLYEGVEYESFDSVGVYIGRVTSGDGDILYNGGLYYPTLAVIIHPLREPFSSEEGNAYETLTTYTRVASDTTVASVALSLNFTINGSVKAVDLYGIKPYDSPSASITPHKYWPYKDAAGVALYDEDTGELV